jgi:hypothetical protein
MMIEETSILKAALNLLNNISCLRNFYDFILLNTPLKFPKKTKSKLAVENQSQMIFEVKRMSEILTASNFSFDAT